MDVDVAMDVAMDVADDGPAVDLAHGGAVGLFALELRARRALALAFFWKGRCALDAKKRGEKRRWVLKRGWTDLRGLRRVQKESMETMN